MIARILLAGAVAYLLSSAAMAQASIVGLNLRGPDRLFSSNTATIVAGYSDGPNLETPREILALDLDAAAQTMWGIDFATSEYGTINVATGAFQSMGVSTLPLGFANSMTAAPDGNTWYVVGQTFGNTSELWVGDVRTGMFSQVGIINSLFVIDIACDLNGNLFGLTLVLDSLVSIDTSTGAGTHIGFHGRPTDFAQGLDFDWGTGLLHAMLYEGGGVGRFCTLDTTTGAINNSMSTNALNAQLKFAVEVSINGSAIGDLYCVGAANSAGTIGQIGATGSLASAENRVTLTASLLPPGQFGIFVGSMTQGFLAGGNGTSNGNICLGGVIGRFNRPGEILAASPAGSFSLALNLDSIPQGNGVASVMPGQTWFFQAWHRDSVGLGSNFTRGIQIDVQ